MNIRKFSHALYQPYKYLVYIPLFLLSTFFCIILGLILIAVINDRVANKVAGTIWGRFNCYIAPIHVTVTGKENIIKGQPYIVIANHQSHFDSFLLYGWLGIDFKWVLKKELRSVPMFGYGGEKVGHIFIDRSDTKAAYESLREARKKTDLGSSIIILPEGTRAENEELAQFKKGAFVMALDLNLPMLPVTINNTKNILPPRSFDLFPGKVYMQIHEPVDTSSYTHQTIDVLMHDARNIIRKGLHS